MYVSSSSSWAPLADVVFGNPFSAERAAVIARLAPGAKLGDLTQDREALARLVAPRLAPWLSTQAERLKSGACSSWRCFTSATTATCRRSTRSSSARRSGRRVAHGTFAEEAIADLVRSGFSEERPRRAFLLPTCGARSTSSTARSRASANPCAGCARRCGTTSSRTTCAATKPRSGTAWRTSRRCCSARPAPARAPPAAAIGRSAFIPYLPAERRFAANFAESFIAINLSQFPRR